jgi:hypothetical protein
MILSFSEDLFKDRIKANIKIHTIRTDRTERWKKGQIIHFWRGNPRNTKANPKPHQFHESACRSVQDIQMSWECDEMGERNIVVKVDNRKLSPSECQILAVNDGFDNLDQMIDWFDQQTQPDITSFRGRLIHWTKYTY